MPPSIGVRGDGFVTEVTPGGSQIRWSDGSPADDVDSLLPLLIARLRAVNRVAPAREISLAITHCEEALHWLQALNRRHQP